MVLTAKHLRAAVALTLCGWIGPQLLAGQTCPEGRVQPDLGIQGIDCLQCTIVISDTTTPEGFMTFGAEPVLRQIRPGGPADGKLREGDVLVAVDGRLITTAAGARRFNRPEIGKPVLVTVRRGGHDVTLSIVPTFKCVGKRKSEPPPAPPSAPARSPSRAHRGWLGIAIQCSWCSSQDQPDGTEKWTFRDFPEVVGVDSGGPAYAGGLRARDIIRAIDGVALTSADGGHRWGSVRPGDRIRITYERKGTVHTTIVTAIAHEPDE